MKRLTSVAALIVMGSMGSYVEAAPAITDNEEHVFRGFFDRQSSMVQLHRLALEKGSTDIKTLAQSEIDLLATLGTEIARLGDKFGLVTRELKEGERSPTLGQGLTRGFDSLPDGATWYSAGVNPLGSPPAGLPPMKRYEYDLTDLQKLSGDAFNKEYLLRISIAHNAMIRHISTTLNEANAAPELVAFAKKALKSIVQQNSKIDSLLAGNGLNAGPPGGARPAGAGGAPQGVPGQAPPR